MYGNVQEVAALPTAYGLPPGGGGAHCNVQQVAALPTAYGLPPQAAPQNDVYSAAVMPTMVGLPADTGYGGHGGYATRGGQNDVYSAAVMPTMAGLPADTGYGGHGGYAPMNGGQGGYAAMSGGQGYGSMDGYAPANGAQGVYGAAVMPTLQSLPAEGPHGGYGGKPAAWSSSQQADPIHGSWDGGGGQYAPVPGAQSDPSYGGGGTPWAPGSMAAGKQMDPWSQTAPGYDASNSYGGCPGTYGTHPGLDMYSGILSSAPPSAMQTHHGAPFQSDMSSGYVGSGTVGGKKKRRKKKCFCC